MAEVPDYPTGVYTVTNKDGLLEHADMKTTSVSTGKYFKGNRITIYKVYPVDIAGIIWGRTSNNVGPGNAATYVGLQVKNNPKVQLEQAVNYHMDPPNNDLARAVDEFLRDQFGFNGPRPNG